MKPGRIHGMINGTVSPTVQFSSHQNAQNYPFQTYVNSRF